EELRGGSEYPAAADLKDAEPRKGDGRELLSSSDKGACPPANGRHPSGHQLLESFRCDEPHLDGCLSQLLDGTGVTHQQTAGQGICMCLLDGGVLAHKVDDLLEEGRISAPLGKPQANAAWKYVLYGDRLHQHLVARSSPAGRVNRKRATARLVP